MTISTSMCGKANAYASLKKPIATAIKNYSTSPASAPATPPAAGIAPINGRVLLQQQDQAEQRELFINVLNANTTKRDAKSYLARFKPAAKDVAATARKAGAPGQPSAAVGTPKERNARSRGFQHRLDRAGVNLGGLYTPSRAIAETPVFGVESTTSAIVDVQAQQLHVALVCLKSPEDIDDATLEGLAVTLAQLVKLDMRLVIVLDSQADESLSATAAASQDAKSRSASKTDVRAFRKLLYAQALRLSAAIGRHSPDEGRFVPGALELLDPMAGDANIFTGLSEARVAVPELILEPLKRGLIPILPPLAYTESGQLSRVSSTTVMTTLTKSLVNLQTGASSSNSSSSESPAASAGDISLDRIIVLDKIGGIPSRNRGDGAHVFINLEQEFADIEQELAGYATSARQSDADEQPLPSFALNACNPGDVYAQHRANLEMTQQCLAALPSASSALIITPQEAASSSQKSTDFTLVGAATRSRKNSLIHNLLTNKPLVSSSLPAARLPFATDPNSGSPVAAPLLTSTLVKRGMPLTIIPAADRRAGWTVPADGVSPLDLATDPRVDWPRLVHLIEDSFRRKLDADKYLARIRGRTAGLIVAGDYEGGAILTWELPPGVTDPARMVPYLDKFAVQQSSQGSSGVADIVFQAMVRSCFPAGLCWRSRQNNPVNKWYLERSAGTWRIPESNWTIFWTGAEGVVEERQRWEDYVGVCRSIQPSWAD